MNRDSSRGTQLKVVVTPDSKRESMEYSGDVLKVKVKAPAEKGKANKAVLNLISKKLGECELVSGHTSKKKVFLVKTAPERLAPLLKSMEKQG